MKAILTFLGVAIAFACAGLLVAAAGGVQWGTADAGMIAVVVMTFTLFLGPLATVCILDAME